MDYPFRVWRYRFRVCECPIRMWFVTFLGVEVTLKDVGVPFNNKGLPFQSVGVA